MKTSIKKIYIEFLILFVYCYSKNIIKNLIDVVIIAGTKQKGHDPYLEKSPTFFTSGRNFTIQDNGLLTGLLKKLDGTEREDSINLNNIIGVE